jgi:DNA polymerase-1
MVAGKEPTSKLLLVDGHAYAYRAFHALRSLASPAGLPTNAVYGFIKAVAKLREQLRPTHAAIVWDGGLATERLALLPTYKARRPPMPAPLAQQLALIVAWLQAAGLASHCQPGVEADDWIATLARLAVAAGAEVIIASTDKDFMQLVSPRLGLLNPNDQGGVIRSAAQVRAKTGVAPEQIVDWLSLVGDRVDNIAGVPGVGPKTAASLLAQFGSWEALLARVEEVAPEKTRAQLKAAAELVERNRRMIRLNGQLPCAVTLAELACRPADQARLRELYSGWGFRSLLGELDGEPARQAELF